MRWWLIVAGLAGAAAVAVGALAAHAVDPEDARRLETAVRYQMWHALALLAVDWLAAGPSRRWAVLAGRLFVVGLVLFCGTLQLAVLTGVDALNAGAPFGGIAFILGWLALTVAGLRWRSDA